MKNATLRLPPQWPQDALQRFDAVVPSEYVTVRRSIERHIVTEQRCIAAFEGLASLVFLHAAVPSREICRLARERECRFDADAGTWTGENCASHRR